MMKWKEPRIIIIILKDHKSNEKEQEILKWDIFVAVVTYFF